MLFEQRHQLIQSLQPRLRRLDVSARNAAPLSACAACTRDRARAPPQRLRAATARRIEIADAHRRPGQIRQHDDLGVVDGNRRVGRDLRRVVELDAPLEERARLAEHPQRMMGHAAEAAAHQQPQRIVARDAALVQRQCLAASGVQVRAHQHVRPQPVQHRQKLGRVAELLAQRAGPRERFAGARHRIALRRDLRLAQCDGEIEVAPRAPGTLGQIAQQPETAPQVHGASVIAERRSACCPAASQ
jgi:hypothetical protein